MACLFLWLCCSAAGQAVTHPSKINLAFQVYDGHKFVLDLTLDDLIVYEEGKELPVDSLELIDRGKVRRHEGEQQLDSIIRRNLIVHFQAREYTSKVADVVEYLFRDMLLPGDQVFLVTPVKIYGFSEQTMKKYTLEELINAVNTVLKRDLSSSATSYLVIIEEMTRLIREMMAAGDMKNLLIQYRQQLSSLEAYRKIDESLFEKIAEEFGKQEGPHHVFLFYEQEFVPTPDSDLMEDIRRNPNLMFDAVELFESEKKDSPAGLAGVQHAFQEAGIRLHFIYLKKNLRPQRRIGLREHSVDMFQVYQNLAKATDGIMETTSLPTAALRRAAESANVYYRLTYTSPDRKNDGSFRAVTIKVKKKDYKISARHGYFDN